ncbi:MAG TPA: MerR family transcriptional regulator [Acidimicrobiales bacterium]
MDDGSPTDERDETHDGLLTIGAFSRACLLSVKSLRAYHEAGILVPARVDPRTGYRAYHPSQLADAAVIRRLRALDLPLDQVREVVQAHDPDVTRRVLARHEAAMRARLEEVTRIVAELQQGVARPSEHTPVHVRRTPAHHTLAVRGEVTAADFAAFLGDAYGRIGAVLGRLGLEAAGPSGALYPPEIPDDGPEPVEAFVPIAAPAALPDDRGPVTLGEVPAARVAVVVHAGPYETIDETYRLLGAWVGRHARPAGTPVREVYLVSYGEAADPEQFRTEIHWPIEPIEEDDP